MMKMKEINIRDPYILVHENTYYMYGTRAKTCWGKADGFDCYTSIDLKEWQGPVEIFKKPQDFWADQNYWAPECIHYKGQFFLVSTFGDGQAKGIHILRSNSPTGPFRLMTDKPITPDGWHSIDGTVFFQDDKPFLVFSHSFEDVPKGEMCVMALKEDLSAGIGEIQVLFTADQAPWSVPIPFAKAEFGLDGDVYFSDGPTVHLMASGQLAMTWSSWGQKGYSVGVAISESGRLEGPWTHLNDPIFTGNGGHGMLFEDLEGKMYYMLHSPNDLYHERPHLLGAREEKNSLVLDDLSL